MISLRSSPHSSRAHVRRPDSRPRVALDEHRQQLAHLVDVVARLPLRHQAGDELARRGERVHRAGGDAALVALLAHDAEVAELERRAVADEDVEGRQVAVQELAAVQLAEHLEHAGDLAPGAGLAPRPGRACQVRAEVAVRSVFERQHVEHPAVGPQHREAVEDLDRPRVRLQELAEVGLAQPAVDVGADLQTDLGGHAAGATETAGQIDLTEAALTYQSADSVGVAGIRAGDDLAGRRQSGRCGQKGRRLGCGWWPRWPGSGRRGANDGGGDARQPV